MPSIASPSNSFSSILISSPAQMRIVGCQTMTILSSEVLAAVQFSSTPGAQQKSVGRAVCPTKLGQIDRRHNSSPRTAVDEEQLRRPVLLVVWSLLCADLRKVPDVYAPVARCRRENSGIMWGPRQMEDFIGVRFKDVHWRVKSTPVP